jgi:hypothetical protein
MAITTTLTITNIQEKVIGPLRLTLKDDTGVIKAAFDKEMGRPGMDDTFNSPKLPGVTAFGLTEGVDMTTETLVDSNVPVSATEVGVAVELSKKMLRTVQRDTFLRDAGKAIASAMIVKQEQDMATLGDGFSTVVGLDGAAATIGHLSAGQTQLRENVEPISEAEMVNVRAVTSPAGWHDIRQLLFPTGSGDSHAPNTPTPSSVAERTFGRYGPSGDYFGMPIHVSNNLVTSTNDVRSFICHKKAGMMYEFMPMEVEIDDSDKSLRSLELIAVMDYGFVELNDGFGREWDHDNVSPTS